MLIISNTLIYIYKTITTTWEPSKAKRFPMNKKNMLTCKLHKINKRQYKTSFLLHVYYLEVK